MANDYVDIALLEIESANGGLTRLEDVVDFQITTTDNTTVVKTMNRRRKGRGYRRGVDEYSGSITVPKQVVPEFDWRAAYRNKEILQIYYEEAEDGLRFHVRDVRITEIGNEAGEDGESNLSISFMALDETEVPT